MALPQLLMPAGTPAFLRDSHEIELISLFADTPMQTGYAIKRRLWVSAPRYVTVALELSTSQLQAFDTWYEQTLQAGTKKFSSQIQNQGPGLLWWESRFLEPYSVEYLGGIWWRIAAKLMVFGDGSATGPVPTTLVGAVQIDMVLTAALNVTQPLSGAVTISLNPVTDISALSGGLTINLNSASYVPPLPTANAAGTSTVNGVSIAYNYLREAGSTDKILREDGSKLLRE